MKKKLLSLALALALCLGLTVPALAEESEWKVEVPGKTGAQAFAGEKTFTIRDWGEFEWGSLTKKSKELKAENVCVLAKGDTAVFTYIESELSGDGGHGSGGGGSALSLFLTAWSDPDGDGVYDGRLIKVFYDDDSGEEIGYEILPADVSESSYPLGPYIPSLQLYEYDGFTLNYLEDFFSVGENPYEVRLSADKLLEKLGPNTLVLIAENYGDVCAILLEGEAAPSTPAPAPAGFTDVADNSPFKDAISWAVEQNITKGTSATTFGPTNVCTHNHILTFLWRANGSPASEGASDFEKAIAWAKSKGLAETIDGSAACTRAQTMVYLWKLAGSPKTSVNGTFTDVAADADYAQAVAWAVAQGVTNGTGATTFSPDATCTRGQIVTFLYRNLAK